jgi:polar amino acid transport system permease protein
LSPRSNRRGVTDTNQLPPGDSALIRARKLPHPWRNVAATVLIVAAIWFIVDAAYRPAFDWPSVGLYLFDHRVVEAAANTLTLTLVSMAGAIALGIVLAIMRQSPNPVLKTVSWLYLWLFRGTPVYVQLVFWGLLAVIYQKGSLGLPFTEPWVSWDTRVVFNAFILAIIGLALNEAAYMAEIVRSGLLSVGRGQEEAAKALGLTWWQSMRRIVLPQAMRVIIPPTGNEVISMLKTTSLVTAVPYSFDLYARTHDIAAETFNPIPLLLVASIWYLFFTTVLMIGQHFLEKRFARGAVGNANPAMVPARRIGGVR